MKKSINSKVYKLIWIIQSVLLLFFPFYEYPDSEVYLKGIENSVHYDSLYLKILIWLKKVLSWNVKFQFLKNSDYKGLLTNTYEYLYPSVLEKHILSIQIIQVLVILALIGIFNKIIKKDSEYFVFKNSMILYLIWPQINYYLFNITTDFIVYMYTPFFIYFLLRKKYIVNILLCILILIFIDENICTNLVLIGVFYLINKILKRKNIGLKTIIFYSIITISIIVVFKNFVEFLPERFKVIYDATQKAFNGNYFTKVGVFFLSAIYLGGHGNLRGFCLLYLSFGCLLILFLKKLKLFSIESKKLFLSLIVTIIFFIGVVPNYAQIKYYTYFPFIINVICLKEGLKKELDHFYCVNTIAFILTLFYTNFYLRLL
jgi:hypothetical protein